MAAKKRQRIHKLKHSKYSSANLLVFALIFAALGGYIIWKSFAAGTPAAPSVYLNSSSYTVNNGSTFTVDVYEDSGSTSINGAQAEITYPTGKLSFISYTAGADFPLSAQQPSGDTGDLIFTRTVNYGTSNLTGKHLIVTITFKAVSSGNADMGIGSKTQLVEPVQGGISKVVSGLNTAGASYTVNGGGSTPPPSPPPSSPPPASPPPTSPPASSPPPSGHPYLTPPPASHSGSSGSSGSSGGGSSSPTPSPSPSPSSNPSPEPVSTPVGSATSKPAPISNGTTLLIAGVAASGVAFLVGGAAWAWQNRPMRFDDALSNHVVTAPPAAAPPPQPNGLQMGAAAATVAPAAKSTPRSIPVTSVETTVAVPKPADLVPAKITPRIIKPHAAPVAPASSKLATPSAPKASAQAPAASKSSAPVQKADQRPVSSDKKEPTPSKPAPADAKVTETSKKSIPATKPDAKPAAQNPKPSPATQTTKQTTNESKK